MIPCEDLVPKEEKKLISLCHDHVLKHMKKEARQYNMSFRTKFPDDIWRLIFSYDRTFHVEVFQIIINELINTFFCQTQKRLTLRQRFTLYRKIKREGYYNRLLDNLLKNTTRRDVQDFDESFQKYMNIDVDKEIKQHWFQIIKTKTCSTFSFRDHVLLLEYIVEQKKKHARSFPFIDDDRL